MHDNGEKIISDVHDQQVVGNYESFSYDEAPDVVAALQDRAQQISDQIPRMHRGERDEAAAEAQRLERFANGIGGIITSRSANLR